MKKTMILLTLIVFALSVPAGATMIPINNPSFENPFLWNDRWTTTVLGWTEEGNDLAGIWNVTTDDFRPIIAPHKWNVAYTKNAIGGEASGLSQVLDESFAAYTDYTLEAWVGNSWHYWWSGYSVQLLAGGTVIAEDYDTLWPDYREWEISTVQYAYNPAHSDLVGLPLEIRLLNLGENKDTENTDSNFVGVEFDNVSLNAVSLNPVPLNPVPEPTTMLLVGLGLLGLAGIGRQKLFRKTH